MGLVDEGSQTCFALTCPTLQMSNFPNNMGLCVYVCMCVCVGGSISLVTPSFASAFAISMPLILVSAWKFCFMEFVWFGPTYLMYYGCY